MGKYTSLLTEEQIKTFQDTTRIAIKDAGTGKVALHQFQIKINGKLYVPHANKPQKNLTLDEVWDRALIVVCYDFGCKIEVPNLDTDCVDITPVKAAYIEFMKNAMKGISKETGKEYVEAMKAQKKKAKEELANAFTM